MHTVHIMDTEFLQSVSQKLKKHMKPYQIMVWLWLFFMFPKCNEQGLQVKYYIAR